MTAGNIQTMYFLLIHHENGLNSIFSMFISKKWHHRDKYKRTSLPTVLNFTFLAFLHLGKGLGCSSLCGYSTFIMKYALSGMTDLTMSDVF